jgi:aldose 1-epimerase
MTDKTHPEAPGLLSLRCGNLVLELVPEIGGSIAALYQQQEHARFDWLRPASPQSLVQRNAEGMASFPLVPFCNRIRNGTVENATRRISMPPNRGTSPHTIHGVGWQRPWIVESFGQRHAVLALDCVSSIWPYRFHARQRFALSDNRLDVVIEVENRDTVAMPLGIGHHPYLPHRPGTFLQTEVAQVWTSDEEVMPLGLEKAPVVDQLRRGVLLREVVADNNFVGWNRSAHVVWPGAGPQGSNASLTMSAESPLDYFVMYSPAGQDHFCIEPVSNCTDWLNLQGYPSAALGGALLEPGETFSGRFSFSLHAEPAVGAPS